MPQPGVSLIIANFNGLEHLADLFDSIARQSFPQESIEIIFVDNGSTDGSRRWVRENYPKTEIIENKHNEGFAAACNKGASRATKAWLAFVNNDMRLAPDWIAEMFKAIKETGENSICAGSKVLSWDGNRIDFTGGILTFYGHAFQRNFDEAVDSAENGARPERTLFSCGGAMLIQKDVFQEVGGFDEDYFAYFEDVDLGWRLWLLGYDVIFAPAAVTYHKRFSTAGKYLGKKHVFLCERNALYTIYKNYSEENLRKILPAALILLVHRALLHAHTASLSGEVNAMLESPESEAPVKTPREGNIAGALRMLHESGIKETIRRARLSSAIRRLKEEGLYPISEEGLSILSALPHLASNLENLNRKRKLVQDNRKRTDSEIFSLFGEPFRPLPESPDFDRLTNMVSKNLGIDSLFED